MIATLLGLLTTSPSALADPCELVATAMPTGPAVHGLLDGDLGEARRFCPRSEVAIGVGGGAIVETENFYGHLVGGLTLDGSYALNDQLELFAAVEAVRYESVISAISASFLGLGHTNLGAAYNFWSGDRVALGVHGKTVLPSAYALYKSGWPLSLDVGFGALIALSDQVLFHSQVVAYGTIAAGRVATSPAGGLAPNVGFEIRFIPALSWVIQAQSSHFYTTTIDHVAGSTSLRIKAGQRTGIDLGATIPFAGRERALGTADLRVSVLLGPVD